MKRGPKDWRTGFAERFDCRLQRDEPLWRHTTYAVGGPTPLMVWLDKEELLVEARRYLDDCGVGARVLGGGSNVLIADQGVDVVVLRLCGRLARAKLLERSRRLIEVAVGAGMNLSSLLAWARKQGAAGLTGLAGIPATVGGAVKCNAGTPTVAMADRLIEVRLLERGRLRWVAAERLGFGYRRSSIGSRRVVVAARLRLPCSTQAAMQRDLVRALAGRKLQPRSVRSAGCFFRNPPADSAGRLIEQAGCKGWSEGGAQVSTRHANFIVNQSSAAARDIWRLSLRVSRQVRKTFGIKLQREVECWGSFQASPAHRRAG